MDRSIVQSLQGLVPALSGPIPKELVDLASSLLAQSRSRASTLKAEEEIARTYACANIACERLKRSLSLPKIEPRPPCPPRVYQKLYRYLETALPALSRTKSQNGTRESDKVSKPAITPQKKSPSKNVIPKPESQALARSRRGNSRSVNANELPIWIMPIIRRLCRSLETPAAPHHTYAGVCSILSIPKDTVNGVGGTENVKVPALIISVYFFVISRLMGVQITSEQLAHQINTSLTLLSEAGEQGIDMEPVDETDVRAHMRQMASHHWVEMDWFRNIELGSGIGRDTAASGIADGKASEEEEDDGSVILLDHRRIDKKSRDPNFQDLRPGLGTMMQAKIDYLSDEHDRDYQEWKTDIMLRIRELEQR